MSAQQEEETREQEGEIVQPFAKPSVISYHTVPPCCFGFSIIFLFLSGVLLSISSLLYNPITWSDYSCKPTLVTNETIESTLTFFSTLVQYTVQTKHANTIAVIYNCKARSYAMSRECAFRLVSAGRTDTCSLDRLKSHFFFTTEFFLKKDLATTIWGYGLLTVLVLSLVASFVLFPSYASHYYTHYTDHHKDKSLKTLLKRLICMNRNQNRINSLSRESGLQHWVPLSYWNLVGTSLQNNNEKILWAEVPLVSNLARVHVVSMLIALIGFLTVFIIASISILLQPSLLFLCVSIFVFMVCVVGNQIVQWNNTLYVITNHGLYKLINGWNFKLVYTSPVNVRIEGSQYRFLSSVNEGIIKWGSTTESTEQANVSFEVVKNFTAVMECIRQVQVARAA